MSPVTGSAASIWLLHGIGCVPSVSIQRRPSGSKASPSGEPKASAGAMVEPSPVPRPAPARANADQTNVSAPWSPPVFCQRRMWPNGLLARGLAASVVVRLVLLVNVPYATPGCSGWTATHSGRSIGVAPTAAAAPRASMRISARGP